MVPTYSASEVCQPDPQEESDGIWTEFLHDFDDAKLLVVCKQIRAAYRVGMLHLGITNRGGIHVFDGSHFVLNDGHVFYKMWKATGLAVARWSSHYSRGVGKEPGGIAQYEIVFPEGWGVLLFGKHQTFQHGAWVVTNPGRTWFQIEGCSATAGTMEKIGHLKDWAKYKTSGRNQGAKGLSSEYTEAHPVTLPADHLDWILHSAAKY